MHRAGFEENLNPEVCAHQIVTRKAEHINLSSYINIGTTVLYTCPGIIPVLVIIGLFTINLILYSFFT